MGGGGLSGRWDGVVWFRFLAVRCVHRILLAAAVLLHRGAAAESLLACRAHYRTATLVARLLSLSPCRAAILAARPLSRPAFTGTTAASAPAAAVGNATLTVFVVFVREITKGRCQKVVHVVGVTRIDAMVEVELCN